jgi:hypothetical protein
VTRVFSRGAFRLAVKPGVLVALGLALASAAQAAAAPPVIIKLEPAAAIPGIETVVRLAGENLGGPAHLWTSFPCSGTLDRNGDTTPFKLKLPPHTAPGIGAIRLVTTNGMSALHLFLVDPATTIGLGATNQSLASAQPLPGNSAVDGVCEELRSAFYRVSAKKGEPIALEVVALRMGSPLDPLLRLLDAKGRELAAVDDSPGLRGDAQLEIRVPKSGDYFVEVRDTRYAGGSRHRYRLRRAAPLPVPLPFLGNSDLARFTAPVDPIPTVPEHEPNDSQPQIITAPVELWGRFANPGDRDRFAFQAGKGERLVFTGRTRSVGSPCDLFLRVLSADGAKVAESNPMGADEGILTNRFREAGTYLLFVEELNRLGGREYDYRLGIQPLKPGFALSVEAGQFSAPAGDSIDITVQAQRNDYDGPIALQIVGLESGFTATNLVIAAKTNVTKIRVTIPEDLELGTFFPFGLTGSAKIGNSIFTARVSTLPALRADFPAMRFPPAELDGLLSLSVSENKSSNPRPPRRKRK